MKSMVVGRIPLTKGKKREGQGNLGSLSIIKGDVKN
jgi:hypothetical protein